LYFLLRDLYCSTKTGGEDCQICSTCFDGPLEAAPKTGDALEAEHTGAAGQLVRHPGKPSGVGYQSVWIA
jgi:hypothetical protein